MLRVQDIMTTDVVTVNPTTSLREAAELFARRHIGGAPVVEGHRVVGVVSTSDILSFAASAPDPQPAAVDDAGDWETPETLSHWDDSDDAASFFAERWAFSDADTVDFFSEVGGETAIALNGHTVAEVMTQDILSLPPTADVLAAAERMRSADVHRLLVMDRGELIGILSTTDLARAVADRRVGSRTYVFDRRH
jgi:CBS domain-containing protein